jgi:tetratricopeptide (TPR) repeat protein
LVGAQDDLQLTWELQVSLQKLGEIKAKQGDNPAALADYEEAVTLARQALAADNQTWRQWNLAASLDMVGDTKKALGDSKGALAAYEESLAIGQQVGVALNGDAKVQAELAGSLHKIAQLANGERKSAAIDEALKIVERLDAEGKLAPDKKSLKDMLLALRGGPQAQ